MTTLVGVSDVPAMPRSRAMLTCHDTTAAGQCVTVRIGEILLDSASILPVAQIPSSVRYRYVFRAFGHATYTLQRSSLYQYSHLLRTANCNDQGCDPCGKELRVLRSHCEVISGLTAGRA
jgi:hypothetical protein